MKWGEGVGGIQIDNIKFYDGTELDLNDSSIILVTGPNNWGKSEFLRNIYTRSGLRKIISEISYSFRGSIDHVVSNAVFDMYGEDRKDIVEQVLKFWDADIDEFLEKCQTYSERIGTGIEEELVKYIPTYNRTTGVDYEPDRRSESTYVFRAIHESKSLEQNLHDIVKATFGTGIVINRDSFADRGLKFIDRKKLETRSDQGESSFARWLEKQPPLDGQGDGVRAFCTVLLAILTQIRPLIIVDEPEAFLQPPQARKLARYIATEAPRNTQVVIATHSNDIVQGLLDFADERVTVIRIVRKEQNGKTINLVNKLNAQDISDFWRDPLLKTSDTLTSLFHDLAIIVEGDSDARFFRAMLDAIYKDDSEYLPDIRFFHCGGKDRVAKIASALKSAGVPVICVVDIDILDNKQKFIELYSACGGDAESVKDEISFIQQFVAEKRSPITSSDAKIKIDAIFLI